MSLFLIENFISRLKIQAFAKIIKNFSWTNADQNSVAADIEGGMSAEEAAKKWIKANPDKVAAWTK